MPKMKTSKTAAKRFSKTGTGKLRRLQQNRQHLFEKKPSTRTRRLDEPPMAPAPVVLREQGDGSGGARSQDRHPAGLALRREDERVHVGRREVPRRPLRVRPGPDR